jgi:uncharacterized protein YkwD
MAKKAKRKKTNSFSWNNRFLSRLFKLSFIIVLLLIVLIPTANIVKKSILKFNHPGFENIGEPLTSNPTGQAPFLSRQLAQDSTKSVEGANTQVMQYYLVNDQEVINHFNALNAYRAEHNLAPVVPSKTLTIAGQWKADDMNKNNYFNHVDSLGRDPFQMMATFGYNYNTGKGENIYEGSMSTFGGNGQHVVDAFKASSGHNAVMLGSYTAVGIGRSYKADSDLYIWTEEFGQYLDIPVNYVTTLPISTPTLTVTPTPTPICNITGKFECAGTQPRICIKDKTGLIRWSPGTDCSKVGAGYTCVAGGSTYSTSSYCKPPCAITGKFECSGTLPRICIKDRNTGLIRWSNGVDCSTLGNYHCVSGTSVSSTKSYCAYN